MCLLALPLLAPGIASAASSNASFLDTSFGTGGEAFPVGPASSESQANAVTVAPAGTALAGDVIAAGFESPQSTGVSAWAISAVSSSSGAAVSGFGTSGLVTNSAGDQATGVAVYPPCPASDSACPWSGEVGDVVVVGSGSTANTDEVAAFSTKGALVWSYLLSPAGETMLGFPSVALAVNGTTPTGDAMVADGLFSSNGGPTYPFVGAFTPAGSSGAGSLDPTFGGTGEEYGSYLPAPKTTPSDQSLTGVAVDPSGNIVVVGTNSNEDSTSNLLAAVYLPDGALDPSFGGGSGVAITVGTDDIAAGMALEPEASGYRILVAGTATPSGAPHSQVLGGFTQTGAPAFGTSGITSVPTPSSGAAATGVAVQDPGGGDNPTGIVVTGYTFPSAAPTQAIVSWMNANGAPVTGFGTNGTLVLPSKTSIAAGATAIAPAPGAIDFIAAGYLAGASDDVARLGLARITGQLVDVTAAVAESGQSDALTITYTPQPASTETITVKWSLTSSSGVTVSPTSGIASIPPGGRGAFKVTVKFDGAAAGTVTVTSSPSAPGLTPVAAPAVDPVHVTAPAGGKVPQGYYLAGRNGTVVNSGGVPRLAGFSTASSNPVVGIATTPDGKGYFAVTADGDVHVAGDAHSHGDLAHLPGGGSVRATDIVAIAPTTDGGGYWLIGADGGEFAFGDAHYHGSLPGIHIHVKDIVGMVASPGGAGYLIVGADGGVFAFGRTHFYGSLPGIHVKVDDIRAILPAPAGTGYMLVGADGGAFSFGHGAPFKGSLPGEHIHVDDIVGLALTPSGQGYWMAGSNGTVYNFGDATRFGTPAGLSKALPIAAIGGT